MSSVHTKAPTIRPGLGGLDQPFQDQGGHEASAALARVVAVRLDRARLAAPFGAIDVDLAIPHDQPLDNTPLVRRIAGISAGEISTQTHQVFSINQRDR